MGGPGSGNRWQSGRATCEAALRIDLRYLRRRKMLKEGYFGSLSWAFGGEPAGSVRFLVNGNSLDLMYRTQAGDGEWQNIQDRVYFSHSDQHLGGSRAWFLCPRCHRRCVVLYGGTRFRCRKCYRLVYASTREDAGSRLFSKARKLRQRLGEDGGIDDPFPPKPKGMHWKTYNRKIDEIDDVETRADAHLSVYMMQLVGLVIGTE